MTDPSTEPTAEDLARARRVAARYSGGDLAVTAEYAAYLMASRLARVGQGGGELDAEQVRMARAYGHVYRECHHDFREIR